MFIPKGVFSERFSELKSPQTPQKQGFQAFVFSVHSNFSERTVKQASLRKERRILRVLLLHFC